MAKMGNTIPPPHNIFEDNIIMHDRGKFIIGTLDLVRKTVYRVYGTNSYHIYYAINNEKWIVCQMYDGLIFYLDYNTGKYKTIQLQHNWVNPAVQKVEIIGDLYILTKASNVCTVDLKKSKFRISQAVTTQVVVHPKSVSLDTLIKYDFIIELKVTSTYRRYLIGTNIANTHSVIQYSIINVDIRTHNVDVRTTFQHAAYGNIIMPLGLDKYLHRQYDVDYILDDGEAHGDAGLIQIIDTPPWFRRSLFTCQSICVVPISQKSIDIDMKTLVSSVQLPTVLTCLISAYLIDTARYIPRPT